MTESTNRTVIFYRIFVITFRCWFWARIDKNGIIRMTSRLVGHGILLKIELKLINKAPQDSNTMDLRCG